MKPFVQPRKGSKPKAGKIEFRTHTNPWIDTIEIEISKNSELGLTRGFDSTLPPTIYLQEQVCHNATLYKITVRSHTFHYIILKKPNCIYFVKIFKMHIEYSIKV